jgi:hypothetical protein
MSEFPDGEYPDATLTMVAVVVGIVLGVACPTVIYLLGWN